MGAPVDTSTTKGAASRRATRTLATWTLALAVAAGGSCGDLDNVTTVKDLRVLGSMSEPAGFLVPLDDPGSVGDLHATITTLVADPKGAGATLTFTGQACPDVLDAITAASGQGTSLCPAALATNLPPGSATPAAPSTIEYDPQEPVTVPMSDITTAFTLPAGASPSSPAYAAIQDNRDYGVDAIVNLNFVLGAEAASSIKRVVLWPLLPDNLLLPADAAHPDCPSSQVANQNPVLMALDFFEHRIDGNPMDPWTDAAPTLSIEAKDQLYVQPSYDPASIERYFLRVNNGATGLVETQCRHELLTFQFYATAGTFSPEQRATELSPIFTSSDGKVHTDSQWSPPKLADLPPDGKVTIWVVARDERAGQAWLSRDLVITP